MSNLDTAGTETLIRPLTPPVPGTTQQDGEQYSVLAAKMTPLVNRFSCLPESGAATTSSAFTPPIQRSHTSTNVNETPTRSVPFSHTDLFDDIPLEPPPGYSASGGSRSNLTAAQIQERITQLEQSLTVKTKGSLAIRPYTLPGNIDAVLLMYTGMARAELTQREIPTPTYLHPALGKEMPLSS